MNISRLLQQRYLSKAARPKKKIALFGVCEDRNSSYKRGAALAPSVIRNFLYCDSSNTYSEVGVDVAPHITQFGDWISEKNLVDDLYGLMKDPIHSMITNDQAIPLAIGGDHSISSPLVRIVKETLQTPLTIVHFDAHPDLYPIFQENPSSHASPFARILEQESLCTKLISIGLRTTTQVQQEQIMKYNVHCIDAKDFPAKGSDIRSTLEKLIGPHQPVYVSFDMDVIEPVSRIRQFLSYS